MSAATRLRKSNARYRPPRGIKKRQRSEDTLGEAAAKLFAPVVIYIPPRRCNCGERGYVVRRENRPPIAVKRRNLTANKYIVADKPLKKLERRHSFGRINGHRNSSTFRAFGFWSAGQRLAARFGCRLSRYLCPLDRASHLLCLTIPPRLA